MDLHVINDSTITGFVADAAAFKRGVDNLFSLLDSDRDGLLSRKDLVAGLRGSLMLASTYLSEGAEPEAAGGLDAADDAFERFDRDRNGGVDRKEFHVGIEEAMRAVAAGIGGSPVILALMQGSILTMAVEHERANRAKN